MTGSTSPPVEWWVCRMALPAEQVAKEDWHNKHAAFVLDLRQYLASLKSNTERERLLVELQGRLKMCA
jgi:hypothetical protein